ncbi:PKD repeat-containing protein [Haloferula helveola]|uniref:PKD repeat-containing protein n=1 Tax=Haloferula helveola TaxID=490095 RepID=A0ABM7R712_9BACT|nr:PKD repeat-containing protein [Haloferula helveola]
MKPATHLILGASLLAISALWVTQRPASESDEPSKNEAKPANRQSANPSDEASGHSCDGSCNHASGPVSLRRVQTPARTGWQTADPGEWVDLGFALEGMTQARVISRKAFDDGRITMSLELPNGESLFISRIGDEWEGRMLPRDPGNGWILRGKGNEVELVELPFSSMICASTDPQGNEFGGLLAAPAPDPEEGEIGPPAQAVVAPPMNSLPGANGVIYLDFDGENVTGTFWNSYSGIDPIVAPESGLTLSDIDLIWERVSEDYRPFNVNVTTDRSVYDSYPVNRRTMVIFSPYKDWYSTNPAVGGVASTDIFGSSFSDTPAWVFTAAQSYIASNCHEAASHEAGHVLGLHHDGNSSTAYYEGHGSGLTTWAPIMGLAYTRIVSQWSKGEYAGANNAEDDLAIITKTYNGLGYRDDDYGNDIGSASPMTTSGTDSAACSGIIERNTDADVFSFSTAGGSIFLYADNNPEDPNLDIRMRLLDAAGAQIIDSNASFEMEASISTTLAPGTYFIEISGAGAYDPSTGYSDYGSLGSYSVSGTVPLPMELTAEITSPSSAQVSLPEGTGLVLEAAGTSGTLSWQTVAAPAGGIVDYSSPSAGSTHVTFSTHGIYQIQLTATSGPDVETDTIEISVDESGAVPLYAAQAAGVDLGPDGNVYGKQIALNPTISDDGLPAAPSYEWTVLSGDGLISSGTAANPTLTFPTAATTRLRLTVNDGDHRTFDEIELTAVFEDLTFIAGAASATVTNSTSGVFDLAWKTPGFNDTAWTPGSLGTGFDVNKGNGNQPYLALIGSNLNLATSMKDNSVGCLIRVPFEITDPAAVLLMDLRINYDDGFIAYINGHEVARANVPNGPPAWNTAASSDRPDPSAMTPSVFQLPIAPDMFVEGTNILAIYGANWSIDSRDDKEFLISATLDGTVTTFPEPPSSPFLTAVSGIADPAMRTEEADADGDGRSNFYEHGAGTALDSADASYPMVGPADPSNFRITLPASPPSDVVYRIEHNNDLGGSWDVIAQRTGAGPWSGAAPASVTPVPGNREAFEFATPAGNRGFFRLRMELATP